MAKKLMPFKERAEHLTSVSRSFVKEFPATAKWILRLAETIKLPKVTYGEVMDDLKDVFDAFKVEYVGSDENANYRERCFDGFTDLIWGMIKKSGQTAAKTFENLIPAFEIGNQALGNIAEIYQALVASKNLSEKRRYYGLCFMYLVFVEGVYDEDIRILYTIKKATEGVNVEYAAIQEKSLGDFKGELNPVFFEGYSNRLRNAIAHARFSFQNDAKKMTFKDRKNRKQPEFCETLSIQEFGVKYYGKIDNLCRLRNHYMLLLGVRDLTLAPKPFGKASLFLE